MKKSLFLMALLAAVCWPASNVKAQSGACPAPYNLTFQTPYLNIQNAVRASWKCHKSDFKVEYKKASATDWIPYADHC